MGCLEKGNREWSPLAQLYSVILSITYLHKTGEYRIRATFCPDVIFQRFA